MDEIVKRLHEKKQIELAKSILEDNGYKVNKKSKRLKESYDGNGPYDGSRGRISPSGKSGAQRLNSDDPSSQVYNVLNDLGIHFEDLGEEDGVIYVSREEPFSPQELNKVWYTLTNAESSGFEDQNKTMWFAFPDSMYEEY